MNDRGFEKAWSELTKVQITEELLSTSKDLKSPVEGSLYHDKHRISVTVRRL